LKKLISPILLCGALAVLSMPAVASLQLNANTTSQPLVKKPFDVTCDAAYGDKLTLRHGMWGRPWFVGNAQGEIWYRADGRREVHVTSYNIRKNDWVLNAGNKANLNLLWSGTKSRSQDNLKQYTFENTTRNPIQVSISAGVNNDWGGSVRVEFVFDKSGNDERCEANIT
jgi:hypothetical protein